MIVISDTTPLISLMKVGLLDLLGDYFGEVQIPMAVFQELTSNIKFAEEAKQIKECKFIKVIIIDEHKSVDLLRKITGLDLGESEAIILSDNLQADLLLMDEAKGREVAEQIGLKIMGTIGLLIAFYQSGNVTAEKIQNCVEILRNSGRHIGEKYFQVLLNHIKK